MSKKRRKPKPSKGGLLKIGTAVQNMWKRLSKIGG